MQKARGHILDTKAQKVKQKCVNVVQISAEYQIEGNFNRICTQCSGLKNFQILGPKSGSKVVKIVARY